MCIVALLLHYFIYMTESRIWQNQPFLIEEFDSKLVFTTILGYLFSYYLAFTLAPVSFRAKCFNRASTQCFLMFHFFLRLISTIHLSSSWIDNGSIEYRIERHFFLIIEKYISTLLKIDILGYGISINNQ